MPRKKSFQTKKPVVESLKSAGAVKNALIGDSSMTAKRVELRLAKSNLHSFAKDTIHGIDVIVVKQELPYFVMISYERFREIERILREAKHPYAQTFESPLGVLATTQQSQPVVPQEETHTRNAPKGSKSPESPKPW